MVRRIAQLSIFAHLFYVYRRRDSYILLSASTCKLLRSQHHVASGKNYCTSILLGVLKWKL